MIIQIKHNDINYNCDLSRPLDISIPLGNVKCFYAPDVEISPFESGDFIGSVRSGSPVNFFNVSFNPHGNGTHTESLGHITLEQESVNQCLQQYHFVAQVLSVAVTKIKNNDLVISSEQLKKKIKNTVSALVLRTLPNNKSKLTKDYSGSNPPYLSKEAMELIVQNNVQHLLIDLPSVDREQDDGKLVNHRLFWNVNSIVAGQNSRRQCTITELIYVSDEIEDGMYLINVQIPSLELDAVPSKPVLYKLYQ